MTSSATAPARWQFWIDRGGTFTDVVGRRPDGTLATAKLLSENPEQYPDAALEGIRRLLGLPGGEPVPAGLVEAVKMGTTVATNALLERKGEPLLLVVTRGFADAPRIAYQNRPRLFDRRIVLPELLHREVLEVDERLAADGTVVRGLDVDAAREGLRAARSRGLRACAISLMHGYRYPDHERRLAELAREAGFEQVSVSHEASPLIRYVARTDTTVVDAYLSPVLRRYVDRVAAGMPGVRLQFMQSNGGLTDARAFQGKDSILSGPAGGIVGMVRVSEAAGFERVIGFDMGGTSTDVSHFAGEFEREFDTQVAGVRLRAPMMSIHTVAAGGGSILHFDGARMRVGPDSAGANPGPACYRRGGPLTVTDANVMLGKVQPEHFPRVFGPRGDESLDRDVVVRRFGELADAIAAATGRRMTPEALAQGFVDIANANMANAIKKISVQRGYDVTRYALTVFGGAGGQHACAVADALAMRTVLAHPLAGVLSAYGMGLAEQAALRERSIERRLDEGGLEEALARLDEIEARARAELAQQGEPAGRLRAQRRLHLKYEGTDTAIEVAAGPRDAMVAAFENGYRQRFAFLLSGRPLVVESVSVEVVSPRDEAADPVAVVEAPAFDGPALAAATAAARAADVRMFADGRWAEAPLYRRDALPVGAAIDGPAIVAESTATTVVEPGWRATMTPRRDLVLERVVARPERRAVGTDADPVMLEIFNNLFMSIAEQMGYRLQNTAHSVNIKERLDFSCAVFDAEGALIANAPHMPVHLGSMGASVQAVIRDNAGRIAPGDVFVLNDPYRGGTHLPDVTVVTPVFDADGGELLFWVGSRGHHADIGGLTPGSMPPDSAHIDDEGVLLTNVRLVERGVFRERELRALLAGAKHPARNPDQNVADLQAQVAANEKGREELLRMVGLFGLEVVRAYMRHVQDNAAESVRRAIGALRDGAYALPLDNGATIRVAITVDREARRARVDFGGTSAQQPNNFNAPLAVTTAAVLFVFRTLVDDEIPMNAGCLEPIEIVVPEGCMLNPRHPGAVVAGNVETSMCITNALYGALGVMASGPCTMSNFTFGNARHQYYETISGGSGAGGAFDAEGRVVGGFDGTAVVQTHMTNSRLTDPEVLELRFPVRLEGYSIRAHSGGRGRWRGGDGGVRRIRFLEPMTASMLGNGRVFPAAGAAGGESGAVAHNYVLRTDGRIEPIGHVGRADLEAGDVFVIETPGGGGFGAA
ncbi:MAG TPA: hydantoinase B/oxoprolinase family protein [Burkholderiaceae bacterium]|nr:hydantoinase B/oxoprolinase family protein [Burkholderiaceae bacterium]